MPPALMQIVNAGRVLNKGCDKMGLVFGYVGIIKVVTVGKICERGRGEKMG